MGKRRNYASALNDGQPKWRVVDDLTRDQPIHTAELDAIEAFLTPATLFLPRKSAPQQKLTQIGRNILP